MSGATEGLLLWELDRHRTNGMRCEDEPGWTVLDFPTGFRELEFYR
jgi:hypothetical protein